MKTIAAATQRRTFLKQLVAGSMATLTFQTWNNSAEASPLPLSHAKDIADESYWEMVKNQFAVPSNLIMMNAANLCPSPYAISEQVHSTLRGLGKDVSFQYRNQFTERRKKSLELLAQYVGVSKEEIGITRNTSESNNIIVNGLDLKAGDEVIIWDQNHPTNNVAWKNRAKRYGFIVKEITVPASPQSAEELIAPFAKAITSKTKLIGFSHISNVSGIALPAKAICQLAKEKNILTLLDGAQSFGMMDINLKDIGCDFYSGSTHKWLMGPLENGILYINKESVSKVWPNIISAGWKDTGLTVDEKYCVLGQRNDSTLSGLPETFEFHLTIGKKNVEDRVRQLNTYLREQLQKKIPGVTFVSPLQKELGAGITVINLKDKKSSEVYDKLYATYGIACASTVGVRISPTIYNTVGDIDKVVNALTVLAA